MGDSHNSGVPFRGKGGVPIVFGNLYSVPMLRETAN